jgi:hypothetical protein
VLDNARDPGDDVYGASWIGPPSSNFLLDNETNALTALVAAIPLHNETLDPTPTGTNKTTPNLPNNDSKRSPNLGAIAGGVVGGLAFLALLITLVLCLVRRRQRKSLSNLNASANVTETSLPTRTSRTFPRINREKKVRPDRPRTPPPVSAAQQSATSARSSTQVSSTQDTGTTRFGSVPTELLVRLLNDRLQPARWREDEELPEYASAHNFV